MIPFRKNRFSGQNCGRPSVCCSVYYSVLPLKTSKERTAGNASVAPFETPDGLRRIFFRSKFSMKCMQLFRDSELNCMPLASYWGTSNKAFSLLFTFCSPALGLGRWYSHFFLVPNNLVTFACDRSWASYLDYEKAGSLSACPILPQMESWSGC